MAELQQLREAELPEPFKHGWSNDGLFIIANRSFGDDSPDQNAISISRVDC